MKYPLPEVLPEIALTSLCPTLGEERLFVRTLCLNVCLDWKHKQFQAEYGM